MQNKGAIRLFAILLALTCLYYLSFTWKAHSVEKEAEEYAHEHSGRADVKAAAAKKGDEYAQRMYIDSVHEFVRDSFLAEKRTQEVYNLGITSYTYDQVKARELNLGLDLRGGMNVTLEVSVPDIIRGMAVNKQDLAFNNALKLAEQRQSTSNADFVTLFGEAYSEVTKGDNNGLYSVFNSPDFSAKVGDKRTNDQVLNVIRDQVDDAIKTSETTLRARIDKFGVTQPNIQKLEASGRILVELPGVKDKERVRRLLQGTANLEFWETYEGAEIFPSIEKVNTLLGKTQAKPADTTAVAAGDTTKPAVAVNDTAKKAAVDTTQSLAAQLADSGAKGGAAMTAADSLAKQKAENPLLSILAPSVFQAEGGGYQFAPGPVVGMAAIRDTAAINKMLNDKRSRSVLPANVRFAWSFKPIEGGKALQLFALKATGREGSAALSGDIISDAIMQFDQMSGGSPGVSMTMHPGPAQTWKRLTGANKGKSIAIVLDKNVYSAPTVQGEIGGGQSSITGNFTIAEAEDLVTVLKAGKLPAPARIVEETVVGPTLGAEAIQSGLLSFVIALIVVMIFMGYFYNKAGWVADLAMLCNVFFVMGILASLSAVLTLPGIAGIVLTIGMSVDANILIFERVREETQAGKGMALAIKEGFSNAMSSIIDSNLTTLLLGIILYVFGTGPIQGFATTLIIGIITSLFCAIFITRIIFDGMLKRNSDITFSRPSTLHFLKNTKINFVGRRKMYYLISGIIIAVGTIFYFKNGGFNLGVDFKGGRTYVVRFDQKQEVDNVRTALTSVFGHTPEVKTYGDNNQIRITTTYLIEDNSPDAQEKVDAALKSGLDKVSPSHQVMQSTKVGETISQDIKAKSIWAILFACLVMFVFIFIRFKKWQYGLGAVVALAHDVLVVLSVFVICDGLLPFNLEIDQHFIAAILTVMGYSMTDTVVVFDRIREYLNEKNKKDLFGEEKRTVINYALNSTLSRTINTSLTLFFVLLAIFIFGGTTIKGFTFALLIGIVIGTYSSICIATPVVMDLDKKESEPQPALK